MGLALWDILGFNELHASVPGKGDRNMCVCMSSTTAVLCKSGYSWDILEPFGARFQPSSCRFHLSAPRRCGCFVWRRRARSGNHVEALPGPLQQARGWGENRYSRCRKSYKDLFTLYMSSRQIHCNNTTNLVLLLGLTEWCAKPSLLIGYEPVPIPLYCMSCSKV